MQQSGLSQLTILHLTQKEEMTARRGERGRERQNEEQRYCYVTASEFGAYERGIKQGILSTLNRILPLMCTTYTPVLLVEIHQIVGALFPAAQLHNALLTVSMSLQAVISTPSIILHVVRL